MKRYRVHEIAKKYVDYDMIQLHTELPVFPDARLRLTYLFLNQHYSLQSNSELYTLAASLVQLGMDTHDLIDTETDKRLEQEMRSRQMQVLAGDYFSTHFYHLLSQVGQVEMVAQISAAVCEVNRLKMNLYLKMKQMKVSAEQYLNQMVELKSELFQVFAEMLEGAFSRLWSELLSGLSRCEVILEELSRSKSPSRFHMSWAYWHVLEEGTIDEKERLKAGVVQSSFLSSLLAKYDIHGKLNAKLEQAAASVRAAASKLETDELISELYQITEPFLGNRMNTTAVVNELR